MLVRSTVRGHNEGTRSEKEHDDEAHTAWYLIVDAPYDNLAQTSDSRCRARTALPTNSTKTSPTSTSIPVASSQNLSQ